MGEDAAVDLIDTTPRIANRTLLRAGVAAVVALALVFGTLAVVDAVRGGASSPDALARRLATAVDAGRPDRALALVEPREAAAVGRLSTALTADLARWDVPEAGTAAGTAPVASPPGPTTVRARVETLSDDVAVLTYAPGALRLPDQGSSRGALRAFLALGRMLRPSQTASVADSEIRVLAVRQDGRWYASLLLSLLDREVDPGRRLGAAAAAGVLPPSAGPGSDTPEAATTAAVQAGVEAYDAGDLRRLAPALDRVGAVAVSLYGSLALDAVRPRRLVLYRSAFVSVPQGPDTALVKAGEIELGADGEATVITPTCITSPIARWCLQENGYRYSGYPDRSELALLSRQGAFGLTAVREDGRWRVGVADSLADALAAWAGALTREQAVALIGEARLDPPTGALVPDRPVDATFTSAGYLVRTLQIDRNGLYRFAPSPTGTSRGAIYAADGTPAPQKFFPNDDSYDLAAGRYTVVLWADDAFSDVLSGAVPGPYRQSVEIRRVSGG